VYDANCASGQDVGGLVEAVIVTTYFVRLGPSEIHLVPEGINWVAPKKESELEDNAVSNDKDDCGPYCPMEYWRDGASSHATIEEQNRDFGQAG